MVTKYTNVSFNLLDFVQTAIKSCHAIFLEGSTGHTVVQSRELYLVRGLKLHVIIFSYHSVRKIKECLDIDIITCLQNVNYISGRSKWLRLDERAALSRPGASLRPARARRSRDYFGTNSIRSKLTPICASEPVACLA